MAHFVEKPPFAQASDLIEQGALWNAFIVAASARALPAMFEERIPRVVSRMSAAIKRDLDAGAGTRATAEPYAELPAIDFSKNILPGLESRLRVLPVLRCGWSDLGTPKRVAEALCRTSQPAVARPLHGVFGGLSLAAQHDLLMGRSALQTAI